MAPCNPDLDALVPEAAPAAVALRLESDDLALNLSMLLSANGKGRAPFRKVLAGLSWAGLMGPAFDTSQEIELDRFEASVQRSDALRRERHDFYTRVEGRFAELLDTMQRMKRDYYREIDHLREQLSRKSRNPDFEPENVVFFHPDGYKLPSWEDIVEQLDDMRMKRELLQTELGGDRVRRVPVNMLCQSCRSKFQSPEEEQAAYQEEHRDKAVQCQASDALGDESCGVSVQTDWVGPLRVGGPFSEAEPQPSGGCPFSQEEPTPSELKSNSARLVPQNSCTKDFSSVRPEPQTPGRENAERANAKSRAGSEGAGAPAQGTCSDNSSSELSGGRGKVEIKDSEDPADDVDLPTHGDAWRDGDTSLGPSSMEFRTEGHANVSAIFDSKRNGSGSSSASAMSLDLGDTASGVQPPDGVGSAKNLVRDIVQADAITQTSPAHGKAGSKSRKEIPGAVHDASQTGSRNRMKSPGAEHDPSSDGPAFGTGVDNASSETTGSAQLTDAELQQRALVLKASLERLFSKDPANQRRRAFHLLRHKTLTPKQRAAARLARQLEAIRKHSERLAFARWRGAVGCRPSSSCAPHSQHGTQSDLCQPSPGPALYGRDIGSLVGTHAGPQQMGAAGDARLRKNRGLPGRRSDAETGCSGGQASVDCFGNQSATRHQQVEVASPAASVDDLGLARKSTTMSAPHLKRPPSATANYPWERRLHSNFTHDGEMASGAGNLCSPAASSEHPLVVSKLGPRPFAEHARGGGGSITRTAGQPVRSHAMGKSSSTGVICLPRLVAGGWQPISGL